MKTDLSPDTDVSLLPRADLPVIWDAFKAKAELVRATAETLTVTRIDQKEEMALARTTRLTLREIRIAVEHKRVELGESHLKEIKKVNGAATAIKEFIEPLEARLLIQEGFAERHEANRIAELSRRRSAELYALRPHIIVKDVGGMSQENYDELLGILKAEQAEKEAANRLRVEAERKLAETEAASKAALELAQRVALEEKQRRDAEAEAARILAQQERDAEAWRVQQERVAADGRLAEARAEEKAIAEAKALEVYADLKRKNEAEHAIRVIEALRLDNERAVRDADAAEQKRIRDEQYAKLEAELAQANAAKQAEADAARKLALAPDREKLLDFRGRLQGIKCPQVDSDEALAVLSKVSDKFGDIDFLLQSFCRP